MKTLKYPLLYYPLSSDAVLGILVGTDYQLVERDLKSLKSAFSDYLTKQYKKFDYYRVVEIESPKLRIVELNVRPTFKDKNGAYPSNQPIKIPIPVVYGEISPGYYECYLPLLGEHFYYNDARQLKSLVQHFAANVLHRMSPAKLHRLLLVPVPQMDEITLKVNNVQPINSIFGDYKRRFLTLERLAEQYPYPKSVRRNINNMPEAAWELENEVENAIDQLTRLKTNLLIVGDHGVGKSAVLLQAIRKITAQRKRQKFNISFWRMVPQRITATAKYLGEWQEICEDLVEELKLAKGILWVEDIIRLLQIGGEGPEDSVAAYLISFLQQGLLQMVGEVTHQELESMRRMLPGFSQSFQTLEIKELSEKSVQIVMEKFADYSLKVLKISVTKEAQYMTFRLLHRYYPYERFPGKSIKFLGQCVSEAQMEGSVEVDKHLVLKNFIQQTGLAELFLRDDMLLDQKELKEFFNSCIIGQPAAVEKLGSIVKIFKAGLNNPNKPITTLIFAGPTGVGKTASAKALAQYFFGKGQKLSPLIRIDMSEFQYPGQIHRFIGAGNEAGKLLQEIRERPFSVLLLDEIEKSDKSVFDAFLTVLDEGMMMDAFGRVTNFRNTIIIMTTNLGATNRKSIGFQDTHDEESVYMPALERFFRPEFMNRIDEVVLFRSLGEADIKLITIKELAELNNREGFVKRAIRLEFSNRLINHIAAVGFDERYGARPLQRTIERLVVGPLANWLLENLQVKNQTLWVDYSSRLKISKK